MFTKDKIKPSNMDQLKDLQKISPDIPEGMCHSRSFYKLGNMKLVKQ